MRVSSVITVDIKLNSLSFRILINITVQTLDMAVGKLTYFNVKGICEPIRMIFKFGGIEFEDVRIQKEQWLDMKSSTPFGQLPIYEENCKVIGQSRAIARYAGKRAGLAGDTDWEDLEIDAVVETVHDLRLKIREYYFERNVDRKEILKDALFEEILPFYCERLDKIAEKNNGHLAAGKMTWADIYFVALLEGNTVILGEDITDKYSNLAIVKNKVLNNPGIKNWIETRPKSDL